MNLINDPWIPVIREDGQREKIASWQIAETDNPVMDIAAPRPDFQGALYQFLIGLLQTCYAPEDNAEWHQLWITAPAPETLQKIFERFSGAFELFNPNGPAFLQENGLEAKKSEPISQLLVGEPGVNTAKKNQDLFIHRSLKNCICSSCCATSLYSLSLNGPPGGAGHMAGLIGNGPVFCLLKGFSKTLWHQLWVNLLPQDDFCEIVEHPDASVFPWLGEIKTSESCTSKGCPDGCSKCSTYPFEKNPLHCFWGMPRRIRLLEPTRKGECELCGTTSEFLYSHYITRPNGYRYIGGWQYPLSPMRLLDKSSPMTPLRGNQSQQCYVDWLGLLYKDDSTGTRAARNVQHFLSEKNDFLVNQKVTLNCYFFDMEPGQAKARGWYEYQMPVFQLSDDYYSEFTGFVSKLISSASEVCKELKKQTKAAWFERPGDVKGDTSTVDASFWQSTEDAFYQQLQTLAEQPASTRFMPPTVAANWLKTLRQTACSLFDEWALEGDIEDMDMKRVINARKQLSRKINTNKHIKGLEQIASTQTTEIA